MQAERCEIHGVRTLSTGVLAPDLQTTRPPPRLIWMTYKIKCGRPCKIFMKIPSVDELATSCIIKQEISSMERASAQCVAFRL